ncbi:MAG: hypothetical protein OQJ84_04160 [Xanthomonadales bacterium]|nr:hypothetical protein [Xanthomonadales bacterium]
MKIVRNVFAAATLVLFATSVAAGEGGKIKGHMPEFSDFDLDGDGAIVEQEFNEGHAKRFSERAAEGHELKNAGKCKFADIDADSDGAISQEEFTAHRAEHKNKGHHNCEDMEKCGHQHKHIKKHQEQAEEKVKEQAA